MKLVLHAKTLEEKRIGLAAVPVLGTDEYAQFDYDEISYQPYWNKNVRYPIDIGFYDENKNLIHKTSMEADQRLPVYSPRGYKHVIETNKGQLPDKFAF
jgi:uncharacterized membrane protein (UPF0127 family)